LFKVQKRIIYAIEAVIDIAVNSGVNPVQNIAIARRQGIPKRYLEQTLQTLVKNDILIGSRGPNGGYRLAKERRKIKISDIVSSVTRDKTTNEIYNSDLSKEIIEPIISKITKKCLLLLEEISIEEIYKIEKQKKIQGQSKKKVDFVI
tara:strand:+ start:2213 stop:2656 length:444 start_codon:yes stop_codon:yes gene_type:complete